MSFQMVILKNGHKEGWQIVQQVYFALQSLEKTNLAALNELYQLCLNPRYHRSYTEALVALRLSQHNGEITEAVKNIVLCSVKVNGLTIQLSSPVQRGPYEV